MVKILIRFNWRKVDKKNNNTPIIKDSELEDLAEMLLKDYKPSLLKEPRKIKYQHFLESYLGANLDFHHIYYDENEGRIFGATIFNREVLKVFDKEKGYICGKKIKKNTIVLDHYVMEEGKEGLELFTGLHEGGHLWLHKGVYERPENQLSLFKNQKELRPVVCCRKSDIEIYGKKHRKKTAKDWREHQADYFASAIAMPRLTFIPLVEELLKKNGISDGFIVEDKSLEENYFAKKQLPKIISDIYGVSIAAAYVKLRKFGFIFKKNELKYKSAQIQMKF